MKFPKLIASDLDGTLLLEGTRTVSDRALELICAYLDRGGIFVAASGRQLENILDVLSPVRERIGAICYSGGLCLYRGEEVYRRTIDPALAADLICDIENTEGCEAMLSVRGAELITPKEPAMYRYLTESVGAYVTVTDDLCGVREGFFKVSLYQKDGRIDRDYWKEKYGGSCTVLNSGSVWMDFIPTGVNKGAALGALLKKLNIAPQDCVAFGDNENDKAMLQLVGCPVVMRHAADELKAISMHITDTVEDMLEQILR